MHIMSFVRGVSIGFILGVLFAPDSGASTRRKLSTAAEDIKDDISDTYDTISTTVSEKIEQVKSRANEMMHRNTQDVSEFASQSGGIL
ncbi:hypothetical protein BH11BAC6_BH11BAC6_17110 [soil metagenome]